MCNSNGVILNPACIVKRNNRNAGFTFSVKFIPSSKFANIKFFSFCSDISTTPFPLCVQSCAAFYFNISAFAILSILFENECSLLWDFFSGIPYRFNNLLDRKFITSFVSEFLQVFTVDHSLNLSTAICICTSPCKILLRKFPVKSINDSWPGLVTFSNFP